MRGLGRVDGLERVILGLDNLQWRRALRCGLHDTI